MSHRVDVALHEVVVPSQWATVCVVGAPALHHRARQHVRLASGEPATLTLPLFLAPGAVRVQIEIESTWPAVIGIDAVALSVEAGDPFAPVHPSRFELFNAHRVADAAGFEALCVAGSLIVQITGIDPLGFGPGARLRLRVRRSEARTLGVADPVLAEFARPERSVRATIAHLRSRADALAG